jgi:hypothetical protein
MPAFTADDFFPESAADVVVENPRDVCVRLLSNLTVGDPVRIGKATWKVWRTVGVTVWMTKAGTQGKKLYQLVPSGFSPCTFEVHEVYPGSGAIIPRSGPLARGRIENT